METKNYFSTDAAGNIIPGAQVYVNLPGTSSPAPGITNINGAPLPNPFTAASSGLVQFKAPDGEYDLRVVGGGREFTIRIQCFDGVALIADIGTLSSQVAQNTSGIGSSLSTHERLIFKKKKILSLPLKCPEDAWLVSTFNERFYPQAMGLDEDEGKLLIVGTGTANKSILVYNWPSGTFDRVFVCTGGTVTEGLVVRKEGAKKYLYLRTTGNKLGRYDITTYPANRASIAEESILNVVCGLNFMERNGIWTILDTDNNDLGNVPSRGKFVRTDSAFNVLGSIDCGSFLLGIYAGQPGDTSVSKAQGVADTGYGIIASMGGQQVIANPSSDYGQNGLRVFTYDGNLVAEGMLDPKKFAAKITSAWGLSPTLTENEGVIVNSAGDVFVLTVTTDYHNAIYATEGMLITQEFCADGIDFSDCAVSRNSVMHGIGQKVTTPAGAAFLDPITALPITTIAGLLSAMQRAGLTSWWGYTSSIVLTNIAGVVYPAGCKLSVQMYRSDIFYVELEGFNSYTRWRVYYTGGAWNEQQTSDVLFAQTYAVDGSYPGSVTLRKLASQAISMRMVDDTYTGVVPDLGTLAIPFPNIYGGSVRLGSTGVDVIRTSGGPTLNLDGPTLNHKQILLKTLGSSRWRLSSDSSAESGSDSGSNLAFASYTDAGAFKSAPLQIIRSSGETQLTQVLVSGPIRPGQYTLTTLPSAAAFNGYEIDVTNATGGSKRCRSNGTVWQILNTTTTVS